MKLDIAPGFTKRKVPKGTKFMELKEWLDNNCQGDFVWDESDIFGMREEVAFELDSDVTMFDLRFL